MKNLDKYKKHMKTYINNNQMNKKTTVAVIAILLSTGVMAQKASGAKQDEILTEQKAINEKLDQVFSLQNEMKSLYGSNMDMKNDITKLSYAYGLSIAENMKQQGIPQVDFMAMNKGMIDAFTNSPNAKMTVQQSQEFLNEYIGSLMAIKAQAAKEAGQKWLTENGKRSGVVTTASGLQYEVVKAGTGPKPKATDQVTVHYHGTLTNGEVFDSSVQRGEPIAFGLDQVIKGWTEGVQLMSPGAKYKFYIPSELGYGERSPGGAIGPNEVLIFDVELIKIGK